MRRRAFVANAVRGAIAGRFAQITARLDSPPALRAIESRLGGRLGVSMLDTRSGRAIGYRADERFPMCSTFKWLLVTAVLQRVDAGREPLDRTLPYTAADLLDHAPVTRQHVDAGGMTVAALCAAAIEYSDNTAANLLLRTIDGPAGYTRFVRTLGDSVTRLDRNEPDLNSAIAGDVRDTTSPGAMVRDLKRVFLGNLLGDASRNRLIGWLQGNTTGTTMLRAGLPSGWRVGDKTGSGQYGTTNDVAIAWPEGGGKPVLIAVYVTGSSVAPDARAAAIAEVGREVANATTRGR